MIFNTERLTIRLLREDDMEAFHEMQGNINVLRYTDYKSYTFEENQVNLKECIDKYSLEGNDFWIYAIETKSEKNFVGTCAIIVSDEGEDEIGYRLLERYWGNGYGKEITNGLINYMIEELNMKKIVAFVDERNTASIKILDQSKLVYRYSYFNKEDGCQDRYYSWLKDE